jgi:hypothetical protein
MVKPPSASSRNWRPALASTGKVLHLFGWDKKFVLPFINFVDEHFTIEDHLFIIHGEINTDDLPLSQNIIHCRNLLKKLPLLVAEMHAAKKIILHGLFSSHLLYLLLLQPWLLKKCYWAIWGGDLYVHKAEAKDWRWHKNEWIRRFVISHLGHFITHIQGDYELAQKWYGATGQWHECFIYTSNLYREHQVHPVRHASINILLGNSATPTNNHFDVLEKLRPFEKENIQIFCPLSYGDSKYGDLVEQAGKLIFGNKFNSLREFLSFDEYLKLLSSIDIAIFNHNRQQGVGNITTLLALGKKVFIKEEVTTWKLFTELGCDIFEINQVNIEPMSEMAASKNRKIIQSFFSSTHLAAQWKAIYD